MRLHAIRPADYEHRVVKHLQGTLHLSGKIHMPRRVEQCHLPVTHRDPRLLGKNRNAALALLHVVVEVRILMIHPSGCLDRARAIEQCLRQRRLPGIHMRHKPHYHDRTSAPSSVTSTMISHCADGLPSAVYTSHSFLLST